MSKNGGPSSSKDTPGAKDRDQRALERAARRDSAPPENASADNASHEISNSFDSMLREALHSNPETFELPDNLTVRVNLPEHERSEYSPNSSVGTEEGNADQEDSWLDTIHFTTEQVPTYCTVLQTALGATWLQIYYQTCLSVLTLVVLLPQDFKLVTDIFVT